MNETTTGYAAEGTDCVLCGHPVADHSNDKAALCDECPCPDQAGMLKVRREDTVYAAAGSLLRRLTGSDDEPWGAVSHYEDAVGLKVRVRIDDDLVADFVSAYDFDPDDDEDTTRVGWTVWDMTRDLDPSGEGDLAFGTADGPQEAADAIIAWLGRQGHLANGRVTYAESYPCSECGHPRTEHGGRGCNHWSDGWTQHGCHCNDFEFAW